MGVQSARTSMVTFNNLIMYQDRPQMEIEEMEQCLSDIQQGPLKGLGTVYEHIYTKHHQENPVEYTLTASTRELYIKYCKGKTNMTSSGGAFNP